MSIEERIQVIAIGYLLASKDDLESVDLNAFDGWKRTLVAEMKRYLDDPKSDTYMLRQVFRERFNLSGDDKVQELLMERLAEMADIRSRIQCGGQCAHDARVERACTAMSRRQERNNPGS